MSDGPRHVTLDAQLPPKWYVRFGPRDPVPGLVSLSSIHVHRVIGSTFLSKWKKPSSVSSLNVRPVMPGHPPAFFNHVSSVQARKVVREACPPRLRGPVC